MSSKELDFTERRDDPTTEEFVSEGVSISVRRQHCVDAMRPDEAGIYEFRYEYDLFEFCLGDAKLHGRAYTDEPNDAHFLAVEVRGNRDLLTPTDLASPLARAAIGYLRHVGRTNLSWLDSGNTTRGYSAIP
jgi:hypothetical protein